MKKLIALFLAVVMIAGLVACTSTAKTDTPANETTKTDAPANTPADTSADPAKTDYKIGVSIMELTAYTWYQGVIDGCNNWMTDHGAEYGGSRTGS